MWPQSNGFDINSQLQGLLTGPQFQNLPINQQISALASVAPLFNQQQGMGGFMGGMKGLGSLMGGLSSLAGIFMGFKQLDLMKEQLGIAKDQWNTTKEELNRIRGVRKRLGNEYMSSSSSNQAQTSGLAAAGAAPAGNSINY